MVVSENESDRDNWVRLTLRLPPELHAKIVSRAGAMSLNAAIVHFLQNALAHEDVLSDVAKSGSKATIEALADKLMDDISRTVRESLRDELKASGKLKE